MSKKAKYLIITILAILLPMHVNADCQSDFKQYEKDYKVSYKYNKDTDDFTITLVNPNFERYGFVYNGREEIQNAEKKVTENKVFTTILKNYKKNEYTYTLKANYEGCNGVVIKTGTLKMVKGNPYSNNPLCEGNEEFVLCQKDYDKELDQETFEERINTYIEEKKATSNNIKNDSNDKNKYELSNNNNQNFIDNLIDYISENVIAFIIIVLFIIVLVVSIILIVKKEQKRRRLE